MAYYKRALYSRIYNKIKFDPVEKFAFVVTLCIVTLFSFFSCVKCYASEVEEVEVSSVNNLSISANRNYFTDTGSGTIGYFHVESGYIYHIYNKNSTSQRVICISNDIPAVNVTYTYLGTIEPLSTYDYIGNGGNIYFEYSSASQCDVTREKIASYEGAVGDLVSNVGVNQIWSVFENGTSFIGVVVLVAFGLFLVVLAIKKVSKGKSEF